MGKTNIEWADFSFNPWIGCSKVSPACDNCYAEVNTAARVKGVVWGPGQERFRTKNGSTGKDPLKWNRAAAEAGRMDSVFCLSLGDVWDNEVPDQWRADLFEIIEKTPNLMWLLLSKRIGNAVSMVRAARGSPFLPKNVALGATMINQAEWDRDVGKLDDAKDALGAAFTFGSLEPLLGPINILRKDDCAPDWIIVGGESGGNARPMPKAWVRNISDQCYVAGRYFMLKQWGEWIDADELHLAETGEADALLNFDAAAALARRHGSRFEHQSDGSTMIRVGKVVAGRRLGGLIYSEKPDQIARAA